MNWSTVRLIALLSLLFAAVLCHRSEAIELTDVGLKYRRFADQNYSLYLDGPAKEGLDLFVNADLLPGVFWNNRIVSLTDATQYRWVGWNFELGVRVSPILSVQYTHFSQHALDRGQAFSNHFPVEDSIGFTLHFMTPTMGKSLLGGTNGRN